MAKQQKDNVLSRDDTVEATDQAVVVVLKGPQSTPLPVTPTGPVTTATSVVTRVAANVANVTLLAANANRRGATVANNSPGGANLFLKLGATANIGAGTESWTVKMVPGAYYEVPFGYTGIIDGIWDAADANGEALVDELTA